MQFKEAEFSKDKALWIQKHELCSDELMETRERLETQKLYYLQIISSLKLSYSPVKAPNVNMTIKVDQQNHPLTQEVEEKLIRDSLQLKNKKEKIEEIFLQENIQLEIKEKAKEMAEQLWKDRESD